MFFCGNSVLYPEFLLPEADQGACPLGPSLSFRITRIHREGGLGAEANLERTDHLGLVFDYLRCEIPEMKVGLRA